MDLPGARLPMARPGCFHEVGSEGMGERGDAVEVSGGACEMTVGPGPGRGNLPLPSAPPGVPTEAAEGGELVAPPFGAAQQFGDDELVEEELAVEGPGSPSPILAELDPPFESHEGVVGAALGVFGGPQARQGHEVMRFERARAVLDIPHHSPPQGAGEAPAEIDLHAVGDDHAFDARPDRSGRRHPGAGVALGPRPAVDVAVALQGLDAVSVA